MKCTPPDFQYILVFVSTTYGFRFNETQVTSALPKRRNRAHSPQMLRSFRLKLPNQFVSKASLLCFINICM